MQDAVTAPIQFSDFPFNETLIKNLEAGGLTHCTPIQGKVFPLALEGNDVVATSETGSGKTIAFLLPIVQKITEGKVQQALILAPTREIAIQINTVLGSLTYGLPKRINSALIIGGASYIFQKRDLARKPQVIIATPGRLNDHLETKVANLSQTDLVVLDEADRMLDMGFMPQIKQALRFVNPVHQTLFFSATLAPEVRKLIAQFMKQPKSISIGTASNPAKNVMQESLFTTVNDKHVALQGEIMRRDGSILIFARTKIRTERLCVQLLREGHEAESIHGDRSQGQRRKAIEKFRDGRARILVATDVAARGIDIPHIAHVINFDLPEALEDYIHRVGRTARAGKTGVALTILTSEDMGRWKRFEKALPVQVKKLQMDKNAPRTPSPVRELPLENDMEVAAEPRRQTEQTRRPFSSERRPFSAEPRKYSQPREPRAQRRAAEFGGPREERAPAMEQGGSEERSPAERSRPSYGNRSNDRGGRPSFGRPSADRGGRPSYASRSSERSGGRPGEKRWSAEGRRPAGPRKASDTRRPSEGRRFSEQRRPFETPRTK